MNLSEKTLLRVIACTLAAGLAVPYNIPVSTQTPAVSAEETALTALSKADLFVSTPLDFKNCKFYPNDTDTFNMCGRTYRQGVVFNASSFSDDIKVSYDVSNLNSITADIGHVDNSGYGYTEVQIYLDDVLADRFKLYATGSIKENYQIDVSSASALRIEVAACDGEFGFGNITVDGEKSLQPVTVPQYKTNSAFISSGYNKRVAALYDGTKADKYFMLKGRQYFQGVAFGCDYGTEPEISFNVENVNSITFSLCRIDNTSHQDTTVTVVFDESEEEQYTIEPDALVETFTLDVSEVKTIRFKQKAEGEEYAIADISIDELAPEKTFAAPAYKNASTFVSAVYDKRRSSVFDGTSAALSFNMNGRTYYHGVVLGNGTYDEGSGFSMNVENLKKLSFTIGHVDGSGLRSSDIMIYVDEKPYDKITFAYNYPLKENYEIDVENAKTVRIECNNENDQYGIADIRPDGLAAKNTFTVPEYKNSAAFIGSCYDVYKITDYDGTSGAKTFNMGGRTYYQGYVFGKRDYVEGSALSLNVENINTLTFDLGHVDGSGIKNTELEILFDNVSVKTIPLTYENLNKRLQLDVSGAKNVRFILTNDSDEQYGIGNIVADELTPKKSVVIPEYESSGQFAASAYDTERVEVYDGENKFNSFTMGGKDYIQGITLGDTSYNANARAVFNVENVGSVSFTLGAVAAEGDGEETLDVYIDEKKAETITLKADMPLKDYSYDVSGASRFMVCKTGSNSVYGLGDIKITSGLAFLPTVIPTAVIPIPTVHPTIDPLPTELVPTTMPTVSPTATAVTPTLKPSSEIPVPTVNPTIDPLPTELVPTSVPTVSPTATAVTPTIEPTSVPTVKPTTDPQPTSSPKPLVDLTGDGKATTSDVRIIMKAIVGKTQLTAEQQSAADLDGDGKLNSVDAVLYLKRVVAETASAE